MQVGRSCEFTIITICKGNVIDQTYSSALVKYQRGLQRLETSSTQNREFLANADNIFGRYEETRSPRRGHTFSKKRYNQNPMPSLFKESDQEATNDVA